MQTLNTSGAISKSAASSSSLSDNVDTSTVPATFVLLILFSYAAIVASLFPLWEKWSLPDSFYFFFITMVTIGFGDMVPHVESYYLLSILYIIIGLILTTMCIDLVGCDVINRIHYFGTHVQAARDVSLHCATRHNAGVGCVGRQGEQSE